MTLLGITFGVGVVLIAAYLTYGRWLSRELALRDDVPTPAVEINDGEDFVPTPAPYLFSQHFSAIAAAGPIVGPIFAGLMFGWLPALIWILVGSIFIGGVHDMTSLVASVRHKARSIPDIVREHMSRRAYLLFLSFVWIALVYIVVAFTDITASAFAPEPPQPLSANATAAEVKVFDAKTAAVVRGAAVASSSMAYLALAVVMGLVLRYTKLPLGWATAIFMPLVLVSIWIGPDYPLSIPEWLWYGRGAGNPGSAAKTWDILLLLYCGVAALVPVWALLQPRGFLGGYFLSITVLLAFLGMVAAALLGQAIEIKYPAFTSFSVLKDGETVLLFPVLFVTVACGACSGFHSMISSGTSSKQLRVETDARPIGYGCMLLEAFVAVIALGCVMILDRENLGSTNPDDVFARGMSRFIGMLAVVLHIDYDKAYQYLLNFCGLAFATFIYDTLDVCTRLGRYVLQEFTGWRGRSGRLVCTVLTLLPPLYLVLQTMTHPRTGRPVPAWAVFWTLFGTANQLLAALTLIGITVWLLRSGKRWIYTAVPAVFMVTITFTMLSLILWDWCSSFQSKWSEHRFDVNGPITTVLFGLGIWLLIEAVVVISRTLRQRAAGVAP
ncbi:MAG TPA: carbon starvation CstA family protein [Pirellulales bacterium]|nr:carbon starvation CstA family protein [Pirellulales bacterium]